MPRQRTLPREAFLAKLNSYLAAHIARTSGAGAKVSREIIARQLGDYNRVTLYKWLNGSTSMPRRVVEDFCRLVGLSDEERRELLGLGGYIEVLDPSQHVRKRLETENEASITEIEDISAPVATIDQQNATASNDIPTLPSSPVPVALTTAASATPAHSS